MNDEVLIVEGEVIKGRGLGKEMGFATLNIPYGGEDEGVFVGNAIVGRNEYMAAVHLGGRPTVGDNIPICEVHVLDEDLGDLVGENVTIELLEKIREIEKFPNLKDLIKQISNDVEFVKTWYNQN